MREPTYWKLQQNRWIFFSCQWLFKRKLPSKVWSRSWQSKLRAGAEPKPEPKFQRLRLRVPAANTSFCDFLREYLGNCAFRSSTLPANFRYFGPKWMHFPSKNRSSFVFQATTSSLGSFERETFAPFYQNLRSARLYTLRAQCSNLWSKLRGVRL